MFWDKWSRLHPSKTKQKWSQGFVFSRPTSTSRQHVLGLGLQPSPICILIFCPLILMINATAAQWYFGHQVLCTLTAMMPPTGQEFNELCTCNLIIKQQGTQKGEVGWGDKNSRDRCSYQLFWHVPNVLNNGPIWDILLDFVMKSKDFHLFKCPILSILWLVISLRRKSCMLYLSQNSSWRRSANFTYVLTQRRGFYSFSLPQERERLCVYKYCLVKLPVINNKAQWHSCHQVHSL